jgi:hypothetical protein
MSNSEKAAPVVPPWLSEALDRVSPAPVAHRDPGDLVVRRPEVGQIGVAEPMDGLGAARLVLVIEVDDEDPAATVALLTNELDLATDADLLLSSQETGCPFALLVETDVVGPLWWVQLCEPVGQVAPDTLETIAHEIAAGPGSTSRIAHGLAVLGPSDPRWDLKQSEATDLNVLSGDRARDLFADAAGERTLDLDPALLEQAISSSSPEQLLLTLTGADGRPVFRDLPPAVVAHVRRDVENRDAPDIGFDAQQVVEAILGQALVGSPPNDLDQLGVTWSSPRARADDSGALEVLVADRMSRGQRSIRLLTTPDIWGDPDASTVVGRVSEGLVQLVREYA